MCEPVSASTALYIMMASTAASAIYSYTEQQKAADQQTENIKAGYALQTAQLMERYQQLNSQASDEMGERAREARVEQARLKAIGAESGLTGVSQDRIDQESKFVAGQDMATIEANRVAALRQTQSEGRATALEAKARLSSVRRPSAIGTGLQIVGAYASYSSQSAALKRTS